MSLLELLAITATIFFALLTLYLSVKQRQARLEIQKREETEKQRLYQISILNGIQDRIGYSLDLEKTIDIITSSLKYLFSYSTASSFVVKNDKVVFRTYIAESVNSTFVMQVKKLMTNSLQALVPSLPDKIEDYMTGVPLDETKYAKVGSFFNIPVIVGNNVVGIINISTVKDNFYKEDEITILYQIVAQASSALSKLQDVLETEKGKLTSMIGSLADGVFMVDTNKNLLIINDSARTFLNISAKTPTLNDILVSIGTQYNILNKIDESIKNNAQIEEKEVKINDKFFQAFITPVRQSVEGVEEKNIGASILLHDITLEKEVATIKEDFTHMIVHELRAPLTSIKDSSELMIEVFDQKGALEIDQQKRLLRIIEEQSKSLLEQINQILDAAKIEAGRFSVSKSPIDLYALIQNAIETFMPQANKKQIVISTDVNSSLPKIEADPSRIIEVLNNLISNSLKFTHEGGKIKISAAFDKDFIKVSVSDNGIGIPVSEQKDLFSKYYQIRTTPHQLAKKGTGLGLYIIKGIVEAHGGSVGVISKENEGTTIYFTLPFKGEPQIILGHFPENRPQLGSSWVN